MSKIKHVLVYYQIHKDGKLEFHGNFNSSYKLEDVDKLMDEWKTYVSEFSGYPKDEICFVGVFQL